MNTPSLRTPLRLHDHRCRTQRYSLQTENSVQLFFDIPEGSLLRPDDIVAAVNSNSNGQGLREAKQFAGILEALSSAAEYFDNLADVNDGSYGEPKPNREMALGSQMNEAYNLLCSIIEKPASPREEVAARDEEGWLIERGNSNPAEPKYWAAGQREAERSSAWTSNHMEAIRFARKEDAEKVARRMFSQIEVRICEHGWNDSAVRDVKQTTTAKVLAEQMAEHFALLKDDPRFTEIWQVRDYARYVLLAGMTSEQAAAKVFAELPIHAPAPMPREEGRKTFDKDCDDIRDFVAEIEQPTPEQIAIGVAALDAYYDGAKTGDEEGACAYVYRAMRSLETNTPAPMQAEGRAVTNGFAEGFNAGLKSASDFHLNQAQTAELAADADFPTKFGKDEKRAWAAVHKWSAKALQGAIKAGVLLQRAISASPSPPEPTQGTLIDKLKSLHWHICENTVNKEIIVNLIEDAIKLASLRTPAVTREQIEAALKCASQCWVVCSDVDMKKILEAALISPQAREKVK